jgi:putative phage-type endonuclease
MNPSAQRLRGRKVSEGTLPQIGTFQQRGAETLGEPSSQMSASPPPTERSEGGNASSWRPWGVGGSDIGAIVGLSPYKTVVDVWLEKTGSSTRSRGSRHVAQRLGSYLEPFVVEEYERLSGNSCEAYDRPLLHPQYPELFGHVDRIATVTSVPAGPTAESGCFAKRVVLECKTSSAFRTSEWGPAWSDQVPAEYLVQCLWYLGLSGLEEAHLAVLLGNTELRTYRIARDEALERYLFEYAHRFWVDHVLSGVPPEPVTREGVESLHPKHTPGLTKEADEALLGDLARYAQLSQEICSAKSELERLKDRLAVAMGPAESLSFGGKTLASWRNSKGVSRIDVERLRRERPDVARDYTVSSPGGRRLLIAPTSRLGQESTEDPRTNT